jgi:hypothetical protein
MKANIKQCSRTRRVQLDIGPGTAKSAVWTTWHIRFSEYFVYFSTKSIPKIIELQIIALLLLADVFCTSAHTDSKPFWTPMARIKKYLKLKIIWQWARSHSVIGVGWMRGPCKVNWRRAVLRPLQVRAPTQHLLKPRVRYIVQDWKWPQGFALPACSLLHCSETLNALNILKQITDDRSASRVPFDVSDDTHIKASQAS